MCLTVNKALGEGYLVAVSFFSKLEGVSRLSNGNPRGEFLYRVDKIIGGKHKCKFYHLATFT